MITSWDVFLLLAIGAALLMGRYDAAAGIVLGFSIGSADAYFREQVRKGEDP